MRVRAGLLSRRQLCRRIDATTALPSARLPRPPCPTRPGELPCRTGFGTTAFDAPARRPRPGARRPARCSTSATSASCCARCCSCTAVLAIGRAVRRRLGRRPGSPRSRSASGVGAAGGAAVAAGRVRRAAAARRVAAAAGSGWSRSGLGAAQRRAAAPMLAGLAAGDGVSVRRPGWRRRWPAPALAAVMFQWLRLRAQALLPADTTARLAELQSRIRPHFLFNTLNTALALVRRRPGARRGRARGPGRAVPRRARPRAPTSVHAGRGGRTGAALPRDRAGPLRRAACRCSWELDPDAGAARVPPLLLQPLVENAVRHGVEPADDGGTIRVRTRVKLGRARGLDRQQRAGRGRRGPATAWRCATCASGCG